MKIRLRSLLNGSGGRMGRYIATEEALGLLARPIDALMIYLIWSQRNGALLAFVVGFVTYLILCIAVVRLNDECLRNGFDLTGINELRQLAVESGSNKSWFKRLVAWVLRRRATIFFIGSWFHIDPDYVTLLLRDERDGFWSNTVKWTIPSTLLSTIVWTTTYWAAHRGYALALWLYNHG